MDPFLRRCSTGRVDCDLTLSDESVIKRVRRGDTCLFEVLVRRLNRRLRRIVRAIVGDDAEADDVLQETYASAWSCLARFRGQAAPATWITRIAINAACARARRRRFIETLRAQDGAGARAPASERDPEQIASARELAVRLEQAIDSLPEIYHVIFVMRMIEELDTEKTASLLSLSQGAVRVRLHRARAMLRDALGAGRPSDEGRGLIVDRLFSWPRR